MPIDDTKRGLLDALSDELGRELSARTVLFHQAVASHLGLHATDHKCLDIALRHAREGVLVNAGQLAEATGLTTGAITGVLDRLEQAGFIRRERDPDDRRQVRVVLVPDRVAEIASLFAPFDRAWRALCEGYTHEELSVVHRFVHDALTLLHEETARLHPPGASGVSAADGVLTAPLGEVDRGVLEVTGGIAHLTVRAEPGPHLYRARFEGGTPRIAVHDGRVTLNLTRSVLRLLKGARDESEMVLARGVPWSLQVRGGAFHLSLDLPGAIAARSRSVAARAT